MLDELARRIHADAVAKGFWDEPRRLPEILTLAHSELSEAFEAWRDDPVAAYRKLDGREGWAVEVIDCIIVCLDILAEAGVPIDLLMQEKMVRNRERERLHGRGI